MAEASSDPDPAVEFRLYEAPAAYGQADQVWPCYQAVFGDFDDRATWRRDLFDRHAARAGYRLAVATDAAATAGFAWGYLGERGQYWTDLVSDVLPPEVTSEWVGGHFEFVELAVLTGYRRHGIGSLLHDVLLRDVRQKCLLSTADDPDDPAVRLYLRHGWQRLGVLSPGFQVMGRPAR